MEPNTESNSTAADYNAHFSISFETAVVTLTKELDYSYNNYYQFDVFAQDDMGTGNIGIPADLIIRVLDVQNKPPFFKSLPYRATIKENTNKNSPILKVSARDGDTGIPNPVNYTILPGVCSTQFSIDQKGQISTSKAIDRDKDDIAHVSGVCVLIILAQEVDLYPDDQHGSTNATADVTIIIEDENDNAPKFENDTYIAEVQENTPGNVPITLLDPVEILVSDLDQVFVHDHWNF
ncbi:protocadherin-23-like [Mercenaria mercenaria]|uniref:protocadherin-23-like n=1 Tax=Mercenaria mercenaria TaxID=6596 RepID=UPI00234E9736|nr:protocadherin-23-like [Mercenaria mercenaria]